MDYILKKRKKIKKFEKNFIIDGFVIKNKNRPFKIEKININYLIITNKKMAHPYVYKIVLKKYNKLIEKLTDNLVDDDGESIDNILNMIEKFRQEIKNKYRKYLKKHELEMMAKKLKFIQKQAEVKQIAIINSLYHENTVNRSK